MDVVRTLLKNGGPVDLDDCLIGIFILLAVIHGDDALSSKLRIEIRAHRLLQCLMVTGLLGLGTGLAAHLLSSAYVSSTSSYCCYFDQSSEQVEVIQ